MPSTPITTKDIMAPIKSLRQRETELQALLATPAGREELQDLESTYASAGGKLRPERTSIVTYILVYEREMGMIVN